MAALHDPERCPACGAPGRVIESRHEGEYRRRRRTCSEACGAETWTSYESTINVQRVIARVRRRRSRGPDPPPASATPTPPAVAPSRQTFTERRVSRSRYLSS